MECMGAALCYVCCDCEKGKHVWDTDEDEVLCILEFIKRVMLMKVNHLLK